jgi:hypothetical protein
LVKEKSQRNEEFQLTVKKMARHGSSSPVLLLRRQRSGGLQLEANLGKMFMKTHFNQ